MIGVYECVFIVSSIFDICVGLVEKAEDPLSYLIFKVLPIGCGVGTLLVVAKLIEMI